MMDATNWKKQTKESWLDYVRKKNPELTNSDYFRRIEDGIEADAFAFPSAAFTSAAVIKEGGYTGNWKSGTKIIVQELSIAKSSLDLALIHGVEYIHFELKENFTISMLESLMENVHLNMISSRWSLSDKKMSADLQGFLQSRFGNSIRAYFTNDIADSTANPSQTICFSFPGFDSSRWSKVLYGMLLNLKNYSGSVFIQINFSHDFLLNICSLRALKLVLNKIWKVYNLPMEMVFEINIDPHSLDMDVHSNVYKLTAIALSASVSGIDYLVLPECDTQSAQKEMRWLKTSLHIQHILKQESNLSLLTDPLAGSYFIEDLTEKIAGKLWHSLKTRIQND